MRAFMLSLSGVLVMAIATCGSSPEPTPTPLPTPIPVLTSSFKVPAGNAYRVTFDMNAGNRLEFAFQADLDINVSFVAPNGHAIGEWARVDQLSGRVLSTTLTGPHELVFDNSFSLFTSKSVTLYMRVLP